MSKRTSLAGDSFDDLKSYNLSDEEKMQKPNKTSAILEKPDDEASKESQSIKRHNIIYDDSLAIKIQ